MIQAVFIDRDGTIGGSNRVEYPGEFQLFSYVPDSLERLRMAGVKLFSFTNQPGISRGEATQEDFVKELEEFGLNHVYLCPHEQGAGCKCRKPDTGMLMQAKEEYDLDLALCVVVGDRWTDILAAEKAGCISILVQTGAGEAAYKKYRDKEYSGRWAEVDPVFIAEDFEHAVDWILAQV